jgi:hypothetical protein
MIQVMYLALNIGLMFVLMKNMDRGGTPSARTQYLRRLGLMSMTIFFLEPVIGATLRRLYIAIFGPDIFPWNFIPAISYIVLLVVIWSLIARYWSRRQYIGSFEWLITWIMMRLGAPTKRLDTSSL